MQYIALKGILIGCMLISLNGCSFYVSRVTDEFGNHLSQAILNHNDPETVANAIPSYLLLLESLIENDPDNESLLSSASTLYGAYISLLSQESNRSKQLSQKALNLALRSACIHEQQFCHITEQKFDQFELIISQVDSEDIDVLYTLGSAWAVWVQANKTDWNAIAQLAQVKMIMTRVVELDDEFKDGIAHVYLGVLATILPPALGGTPDIGKQYFETALKLSNEKNLMVKVIYAKQYARMMFDRQLHDNLLNAVINAKIEQPGLTLMNSLAQQQAKDLLDTADAYF